MQALNFDYSIANPGYSDQLVEPHGCESPAEYRMFRTADWPHYFEQQSLLNRRRWVKPVGSVCRPAVTVLFLPGAGVEFRLFDCES